MLETGIWLTRGARGRGVGRRALGAVLEQAPALGAHEVRADTTRGNGPALAVLRDLGFAHRRRRRGPGGGAAGDPRNDESPRSVTWGSVLVGDTGIEPVTSSVSGKRATAAPIARPGLAAGPSSALVLRGGDEVETGFEPV